MIARNRSPASEAYGGRSSLFLRFIFMSPFGLPGGGGITRPAGIKWTVTTPIRYLTISCDEIYLHCTEWTARMLHVGETSKPNEY